MIHNCLKFTSQLMAPRGWMVRSFGLAFESARVSISATGNYCLATLMSSDRTKQICQWMTIYIYINIYVCVCVCVCVCVFVLDITNFTSVTLKTVHFILMEFEIYLYLQSSLETAQNKSVVSFCRILHRLDKQRKTDI